MNNRFIALIAVPFSMSLSVMGQDNENKATGNLGHGYNSLSIGIGVDFGGRKK